VADDAVTEFREMRLATCTRCGETVDRDDPTCPNCGPLAVRAGDAAKGRRKVRADPIRERPVTDR
jgi:ribosomal protein S27AE